MRCKLGAAVGSLWTDTVLSMLQATGAQVQRPPEEADSHATLRALVFEASGIDEPNELRALYDFFHPRLGRLLPCGRILILGIPPVLATAPATAATAQALEGFCRILAREVGYRGITVQLLRVEPGAENRLVESDKLRQEQDRWYTITTLHFFRLFKAISASRGYSPRVDSRWPIC